MPLHINAVTTKEFSGAKAFVARMVKKRRDAGLFIPPDPEEMNDRRAASAQAAVTEFQRTMRTGDGDALADLLDDLMHLCDRREHEIGWSFEAAVRRARLMYEEETTEAIPEETTND